MSLEVGRGVAGGGAAEGADCSEEDVEGGEEEVELELELEADMIEVLLCGACVCVCVCVCVYCAVGDCVVYV